MLNPVVHIPEAEAIRDFAAVLHKLEEGVAVVIDRGDKPPVTIPPPRPRFRTIEESLAIAKTFEPVTIDPGFANDVEEGIRSHQNEVLQGWE